MTCMGSKGKRSSGSSRSSRSTCGPRLHNAAAAAHAPPPALLATTTPAASLPSTKCAPRDIERSTSGILHCFKQEMLLHSLEYYAK
jgi:hypothetical protein